jgi:hypothetical protein
MDTPSRVFHRTLQYDTPRSDFFSLKSVQKYEAQNINTTKRYSDGIPTAKQLVQLVQEHRIALEVMAGNNLLNIYKKKLGALQHHEPVEEDLLSNETQRPYR